MKQIANLLLAILISGAAQAGENYFYVGLGLGKNDSVCGCWEDHGSAGGKVALGHRHHIWEGFYGDLSYTHYSQPLVGAPFDDRWEMTSEHLYYTVEWRF